MTKLSNLYLFIYPARDILKVGITNDISARKRQLESSWGKVDAENSYVLTANSREIKKLEKSLHFLLSEYSRESESGSGKTELFESTAIGKALAHIDFFQNSGCFKGTLVKGLSDEVRSKASEPAAELDPQAEGTRNGVAFYHENPSFKVVPVEHENSVKLFPEGVKQIAGLSKPGMSVFEMVYYQTQETPGSDKITLSVYYGKKAGLSERSYYRGLRDLLDKQILFASPAEGTYFLNIQYLFNGDRLHFVRSNHLKSANDTIRKELGLDPSM